jgi:hypothetical protein
MISRYFIILIFLMGGFASLSSQVKIDPAIKVRFDSFILYSNMGQWEKAFNLVYPKLFSQVPKTEMVQLMQSMGDGLAIQMEDTRITEASAPIEEGDETFVRLSYTSNITMAITKGGIYDTPKAIQAIGDQLKSTYGGRSVQWNDNEKEYNITAVKSMMAIKNAAGEWHLIEINLNQPQLMESLFPATIMDQLVRNE